MRLRAISCLLALLALLAWRPFASEEKAPYMSLGSGAELCTSVFSKPGASEDAPLTGLVHITCDLDGALLSLENYYRDSLAATVAGRLPSSRHKPGR